MQGRSLISISDLSKDEILSILEKTEEMKKKTANIDSALKGKILASCFFEPSTRTRLSFEAAMIRLGGSSIGFTDPASTLIMKGESFCDSIRIIGGYADLLIVRHPEEGSALKAAQSTDKPVINAGDGSNQHPTQTLLDLFTIQECQSKLNGLNIAFVGDLKYSRTVHSLCLACAYFDMRLYFVSPEQLLLPDDITYALNKKGIGFSFHRSIEEMLDKVDILYMTRIQTERFEPSMLPPLAPPISLGLTASMLEKAKKNLKILHPFPRVDEIDPLIDKTPYAHYFQQAENGLYTRMALLSQILG